MSNEKSIVGKVEQVLDDLGRVRQKRPWLFCLLIVAFIIISCLYVFDKLWGIPSLNRKIEEQKGEIQLLETQLTPFRTIALERFSGTEAEALSKLAFQIKELESTVSTLQNYATIATYDIQGNPPGFGPGSDVEMHTPLSDLLRNCYTNLPNGHVQVLCTPEAEKKFLETIDKFPDFPFSYYALATCYKAQGQTKWRDYAVKGLAIFDKTTTIKNHNPQHDDAKNQLKQALAE
jgi:tetratricopeptide (TPR) repeat protein